MFGVDLRLLGRRKSELGQPVRRPGATTGGVNDEVGPQQLLPARLHLSDAHAVDDTLTAKGLQAGGLVALEDGHVGQLPEPPPHDGLEHRPARRQHLPAQGPPVQPPERRQQGHLRGHTHRNGPRRRQVGAVAGKEPVDDLTAPVEQRVDLPPLRHALAVLGALGQGVTLDQRHPVDVSGEHPGGEQPRDASADDDTVRARVCHRSGRDCGSGLDGCHERSFPSGRMARERMGTTHPTSGLLPGPSVHRGRRPCSALVRADVTGRHRLCRSVALPPSTPTYDRQRRLSLS